MAPLQFGLNCSFEMCKSLKQPLGEVALNEKAENMSKSQHTTVSQQNREVL